MELIKSVVDFILNIDVHLNIIIQNYGLWTYLILFLIVMLETGLVVAPFLPGDSLLFAAGAFSSLGALNVYSLFVILCTAAIVGDTINYHIGKLIGPKIFMEDKIKFLKKEYLLKTQEFYNKHGGKTIIIARFMPIIRTFAPFVAGIGKMNYFKFISYNIVGGIAWVTTFLFGGYFFGNIPYIKKNFTLVILIIIFISVLPGLIGVIKIKVKGVKTKMKEDTNISDMDKEELKG